MKFGRLIYRYTSKAFSDTENVMTNIGDNMQTYAVDNFYRRMGINEADIIDINDTEMEFYDGEYVIVPMAGYFSHYRRFNQIPTSTKIIPFFISFEFSVEECDKLIGYFKKHDPIGCRDEATMKLLRRKGIEAYLSGCLTITLPKRKLEPIVTKVFFVDIPESLEQYIPKPLKENCEYIKHEIPIKEYPMTEEDRIRIDNYAKSLLERYEKEATLVVTSRLHAASPCAALGIPVIIVGDNIDERFAWLDKYLPMYTKEDFASIDWNPKPIEIEEVKDKIFNLFEHSIKKILRNKKELYELSSYYENRIHCEYNLKLMRRLIYLEQLYNKNDIFRYVIWGAGVHGNKAYLVMKEKFPHAELIAIADNFAEGELFGIKIIKPIEVKKLVFDYALITTHPGRFEAVEILEMMGKKYQSQYNYFMSKDIPEEEIKIYH
ncbi:MAG: polysaccharide pyruvyl transferase family protein [Herbinix sp.]|jgi:hypothetical protein|nr:polysaccharide pyruvyl transferase family protein [Herbinix sp.]